MGTLGLPPPPLQKKTCQKIRNYNYKNCLFTYNLLAIPFLRINIAKESTVKTGDLILQKKTPTSLEFKCAFFEQYDIHINKKMLFTVFLIIYNFGTI